MDIKITVCFEDESGKTVLDIKDYNDLNCAVNRINKKLHFKQYKPHDKNEKFEKESYQMMIKGEY